MRFTATSRLTALVAAAVFATGAGPSGAARHTSEFGARKALGDGHVYSWVRRTPSGAASSFGLSFDEKALTNLGDKQKEISLALPPMDNEPFRVAVVDWNPQGHPPAHVYDVPHFDFHFYVIDESARMTIAPSGPDAAATPAAEFLPAGFITDGQTIPMMGKHYLSRAQPEFHGGTFTATPIYGYYGGHLIFVESMVTVACLNGKPSVTQALAQPARFERPGAYPKQWSVTYDAAAHRYDIEFGSLVSRV
jgi:hypothetical protein